MGIWCWNPENRTRTIGRSDGMTPEKFKKLLLESWPPCETMALGWKDAMDFYADIKNEGEGKRLWVFRGMANHTWKLETSLERAMSRFGIKEDKAFDTEAGLLREFKRHFHHYEHYWPGENETVEWLAMMQHHLAPTRLLDWTYSFYVALYFALGKTQGDSIVWAIDAKWCTRKSMSLLRTSNRSIPQKGGARYSPLKIRYLYANGKSIPFGKDGVAFDAVFRSKRGAPFVYPMNPLQLNVRLVAQQGLFLCPRDINRSFEENLKAMKPDGRVLKRLLIPKEVKNNILRELYLMNITRASLFPGLDGFAESLGPRLVFPESLQPENSDI